MKEVIYLTRTGARNLGDVVLQKNIQNQLQSVNSGLRTVGFKEDEWQSFTGRDIIISAGGFCCHFGTRPGEFRIYEWLLQNNNRLYFWGPGYNEYAIDVYNPDYSRPFVSRYDDLFKHENAVMCGFRDFGNPHQYVPCPSCLDPLFDQEFEVRTDTVILEHESLALSPEGSEHFPKKSQSTLKYTFEEIIRFLGEADTVMTNTYHGAYWALLLNKKVVIYKPWSSKFHTFKYPPLFANETDYIEKIAEASMLTPGYLQESREINARFYSDIRGAAGTQ